MILGLIFGSLIGWGLDAHYKKVLHETIAMISAGEEIKNVSFSQWFIAGRMLASGGAPYGEPFSIAVKAIGFAAILAAIIAMIGEKYGRGRAVLMSFAIVLFELLTYDFGVFGFRALESNVAWVGGALGGLFAITIVIIWAGIAKFRRYDG